VVGRGDERDFFERVGVEGEEEQSREARGASREMFHVTNGNGEQEGEGQNALMKIPFLIAAILLMTLPAQAQQPPKPGCDSAESKRLDFWIGEWDLSYTSNGQPAKSRNKISKILDGCVILEEFTGGSGAQLDGKSFSMYDVATKQWKQTWVDNTGSYLDFVGSMDAGDMVFSREAEVRGKKMTQRMVFRDVKPESLKWLWQKSEDAGKTWTTLWEIDYKRIR
jgi:hypothetical protein